jgi:transcriptional repressor of dcmA and dcmR
MLPCLRIGQRRERRFRRADLLAFLETERVQGATKVQTAAEATTHGHARGGASEHLCGLYSSDEGRLELGVPFLLAGLREGSTCFLATPPKIAADFVKRMSAQRQSVPNEIESGRLVLSEYKKTAREQWEFLDGAVSEIIREGAPRVRLFGEISPMRNASNPEAIVEYEEGYDQLIVRRYPSTTLCGYDARKFEGVELLTALRSHPDTLRHRVEEAFA